MLVSLYLLLDTSRLQKFLGECSFSRNRQVGACQPCDNRGPLGKQTSKQFKRNNNNNNNIFISFIKYTSITPPANSKANRGRWCEDGLRLNIIVEVKKKKKYHIYNKEGQSRE